MIDRFMRIRLIILSAILFMLGGAQGIKAQDYSATIPDGPTMRPDSLYLKPLSSFLMSTPSFMPLHQPNLLFSPLGIETKEQRAARINEQTFTSVMESVDKYLIWYRPPKLTKLWKQILGAAKLFLSNPYGFPEGCVPLMNASFPFIYAKTPGMAPYENPYSPDKIPQCIKLQYDFASGTYKRVMVDWSEVQGKLSNSGSVPSNQPVPNIPVTLIDRMMR